MYIGKQTASGDVIGGSAQSVSHQRVISKRIGLLSHVSHFFRLAPLQAPPSVSAFSLGNRVEVNGGDVGTDSSTAV